METTGSVTTCKNCQTTFNGKFCPNCSQKADTHRFTLKHFAHEFFHAFTHADKGILFLIKKLFTQPGIVAREYNSGMRKKYFNPITFLLITMALQIYVTKKTDFYPAFINATEKLVKEIAKNSPSQNNSSQEALENARKQTPKILENSKILTFAMIPVLALLTWLLFWKSGFNYAENLVFIIFVQGQSYIFYLFICMLPFVIFPSTVVWILYLNVVAFWAYSMFAYKQFFQQRTWVTIFKGSLAQILFYVIIQQLTPLVIDYL